MHGKRFKEAILLQLAAELKVWFCVERGQQRGREVNIYKGNELKLRRGKCEWLSVHYALLW